MNQKKIPSIFIIIVMLLSGIIALVPPINAKEVNCLVKGALYIDNTPAAEGQADVQLFFTTPDEMFHSVTFAWDDGYNYNIQIANGNHYRSVGDIGTFIVHVGYNYLKPYDNRTFTVFEINLTNSYLTHMNLHVNRNDTLPPNKPILIAPSPSGTTISSTNSATLQVLVTDPDGDEMDVSFYNANGNVLLGKVMDVTNGSTVNYTWSPLSSSTTYSWYVIVSDSIKQNTSDTWSFTTATPSSPPPPYTPPPSNKAPTAEADGPYTGFVNDIVPFDGTGSHDNDQGGASIVQYDWKFFDTDSWHNNIGAKPTHIYSGEGIYIATLRVTDNEGSTATDTATVTIAVKANNPPTTPIVTGPITGHKNTLYNYTAVSTDPDLGDTIEYIFSWDDGTPNTNTTFLASGVTANQSHLWAAAGRYTLDVIAYDNNTAPSGTTTMTVFIDALAVDDIGYLIDTDGDGIYDLFHNDTSGIETTVQQQDGNYLIDTNGDGVFDKTFNPNTGDLTDYNEAAPSPVGDNTANTIFLGIIILIIVLLLVLFAITWKKKNKNAEKQEETKESSEKSAEDTKTTTKKGSGKKPKN